MNVKSFLVPAILLLFLLAGDLAAPVQAADACKTIGDATAEIWQVPVHIYSTEVAAARRNQPRNSESIYTASGAIYVKVRDKWSRSRVSVSELKSARNEEKETVKRTCRYVRDEAVNGEPASVYSSHTEYQDFKVDMTIWIAKNRNFPLRSDSDSDVGGAMGKTHRNSRYEYSNVQPPPGVK